MRSERIPGTGEGGDKKNGLHLTGGNKNKRKQMQEPNSEGYPPLGGPRGLGAQGLRPFGGRRRAGPSPGGRRGGPGGRGRRRLAGDKSERELLPRPPRQAKPRDRAPLRGRPWGSPLQKGGAGRMQKGARGGCKRGREEDAIGGEEGCNVGQRGEGGLWVNCQGLQGLEGAAGWGLQGRPQGIPQARLEACLHPHSRPRTPGSLEPARALAPSMHSLSEARRRPAAVTTRRLQQQEQEQERSRWARESRLMPVEDATRPPQVHGLGGGGRRSRPASLPALRSSPASKRRQLVLLKSLNLVPESSRANGSAALSRVPMGRRGERPPPRGANGKRRGRGQPGTSHPQLA